MARTVTHMQIYKKGLGGGTVNTTLCGRMSDAGDDMNVGGVVTCKLCLNILATPNHWRRRFLAEPVVPTIEKERA